MASDSKLNKRLERYMEKEIKKGYRPEVIKRVLLEKKYPEDVVDAVYEKYSGSRGPWKESALSFTNLIIIFGAIVLLATIVIFMLFFSSSECETAECFAEKANNCEKSVYILDEEGTTYRFTSSTDCVVEKSVTAVSDTEPEIIREMFLNKAMSCTYSQDGFDERLLSTLLSGLENCEGELKESLYELAIAQYELSLEGYELE